MFFSQRTIDVAIYLIHVDTLRNWGMLTKSFVSVSGGLEICIDDRGDIYTQVPSQHGLQESIK